MANQKVSTKEMEKIRRLKDFDLVMLISEVHDHGWPAARVILAMMPPDPDQGEAERLMEQERGLR